MEFEVKFVANGKDYAIEKSGRGIGINWLDRARNELSVPELSPDLVYGWIDHLNTDPNIILSESQARKSNRFGEKNTVTVEVKGSTLNTFVISSLNAVRNPKNGSVLRVVFKWKIDKKAIYDWWKSQGFPLKISEPNKKDNE